MMDIGQARQALNRLLERFKQFQNDSSLMSNEDQARKSLIEPFIEKVLHWDTEDPAQFRVEETKRGKRMDCIVYNHGISQFIVEAKALSVHITDNRAFYDQAIEYGYNKEHPFVILTNFKHWIILSVDKKHEICRFDIENLSDEDLETLLNFEKSTWLSNGRDNLFIKFGKSKGTIPVDERLLEDMRNWRDILRKNILKNEKQNKISSGSEEDMMLLEEDVQKFIDRMMFICFCEDKELSELKLKSLITDKKDRFAMSQGWLLKEIQKIFEDYRKVYDSDLFDKGTSDKLFVDDIEILKILNGLRQPKDRTAYNFKSIEADILGKVYENFLGHLTSKKGKEKEDIGKRKKEGIYYTPKYIVDYIVNNTVREKAKGKSFEEIKKIKIVDPACGSGSFLLRAFDVLVEEAQKSKRNLTYEDKKELMLSCIHGVDLDSRAIEIAKLSLSLRIAEHGENIKHGNSLIDDANIAKYNAFEWEHRFESIMKNGGFDVVLGNPPYIRLQTLDKQQLNYFSSTYASAKKHYDLYILFVEKAHSLLNGAGLIGLILPSKFFNADYGNGLRKFISENKALHRIVDFKDFQVFSGATTYTCLLFLKNGKNNQFEYSELINEDEFTQTKSFSGPAFKKSLQEQPKEDAIWQFSSGGNKDIFSKLNKRSLTLGDISEDIFQGLLTGRDKIYFVTKTEGDGDSLKVKNNYDKNEYAIEKELLKKLLKGKEIRRWKIDWKNSFTIYPYKKIDGETKLIPLNELKTKYPKTYNYLMQYKKELMSSETSEAVDETNWYRFRRARSIDQFENKKILTQVLASKNSFTLDDKGEFYFVGGGNAGGFGLTLKEKYKDNYYEVLAILNSKLLEFYLKKISTPFRGGYYSYGKRFIEKLPIVIPKGNTKDRLKEYSMKSLERSKKVLEFGDKQTSDRTRIEEEIKRTDKEIDELVYKLYGITEEEKKIIEESLK